MIRALKEEDVTKVMTIWTKGNFIAHDFIEKDYWLEQYNIVKEEYLKNATTYVYVKDNEIKGFISIINDTHIGALFVDKDSKRLGIGRKLINHCKEKKDILTLNVYEKNVDATLFYLALGFKNIKNQIDENTGEKEYKMMWEKTT